MAANENKAYNKDDESTTNKDLGYPTVQQPGYPADYPPVQPPGYTAAGQPGLEMGIQDAPVKPPNYFGFAVCVSILCCWPFGIVAIRKSREVDRAYQEGDYARAEENSEAAKNWSIASVIGGIVLFAIIGGLLYLRIKDINETINGSSDSGY